MGRGMIAGGGAGGLYSVTLDVGKAERDAAVAKMDARLAALAPQISSLQMQLAEADADANAARDAVNMAIDLYAAAMQANPGGDHSTLADNVQKLIGWVGELEAEAAKVRLPLQALQVEKVQLDKDRAALLGVQVDRTQSAWCVDLTEDAAGTVATIEVPGEPQRVLVAPGGRVPGADDGRLLARAVHSPAQLFWNAAVLPGWQRWTPDYRIGTLTALDKILNTASVQLDELSSSAQGLLVNQTNTLTEIPVVYMTCNAQAFDVGDRVVVQFVGRNWNDARVIGFESNPKPCLPEFVYFPIRHYMLSWQLVGLNAVSAFNILSPGQAGCDPVVVCGADSPFRILQRSEGHFQHSFEYRDGAFFSSSMDGLWVDESAFVLAQVAQGMAVAMYPSTGGVAYLSRDYPRAFSISIGASGVYVQKVTYPNSEMTLPGVQWPAGSSDPCSLHDFATAVVHAGLTVNSSLVGLSSSNEVLVDTANAETFWAWLQSIGAAPPETVTVAGASGTWEYEEPLLVMDPALSSRVLLRYTRPGA